MARSSSHSRAEPATTLEVIEASWADGSRLPKDLAQPVGERIQALGINTAEGLLEDAMDPDSPASGLFEWHDQEAAHQHRLEQARHILRSIRIVIRRPDGTRTEPVKMFVRIQSVADHYLETRKVLSNPERRQLLIQQALREAKSWRARYLELVELSKAFEAIEEVIRTVGR